MHTEFCVDTTTRRALALGHSLLLVEDGHTKAGHEILSASQIVRHHNITLTGITSFLAAGADHCASQRAV